MVRLALSIAGAVASFLALMILVPGLRGIRRKGDQMVEAAKAAGRVAEGVLVSSEFQPEHLYEGPQRRRMDYWDVVYEYTVGNYTGQFRGLMHFPQRTAPDTMPLYYEAGTPEDACPANYGRYAESGGTYTTLAALPVILFLLFYFVIFK